MSVSETALDAGTSTRDVRTFSRVAAAILLPIGPIAVSLIRFILPGAPVGETVAAHEATQSAVLWLDVVALFTLLPGAIAALQLARRHSPVLAIVTGALLVPGYLAISVLTGLDAAALAATRVGLSPNQVTALTGELLALPTQDLLLTVFILGHVSGMVLLGVICLRRALMPGWVAILLIVSQPLHFIAVVTDVRWLDLTAWNLTALGMAFLAWRILHTPNDEWELPPVTRPHARH
jgi:hypothetical protein